MPEPPAQPPPVDGSALPTGGPADSVGFLLSRLGAWSASRFAARLRPLELEPKHAAILRIVGTSGGISQQELAERLGVPASRMVALIDDLEGRGLVERRRNPRDRRAYELGLTAAGGELGQQLASVGAAHEREVTGPLDDEERAVLRSLLQRIAATQELPPDAHPGNADVPPLGEPPPRGRPAGGRTRGARRTR